MASLFKSFVEGIRSNSEARSAAQGNKQITIQPLTWDKVYELATGERWDDETVPSEDQAMRVSPVAAGINFISEAISSMPMHLMKRISPAKGDKPERVERVGGRTEDLINSYWSDTEDSYSGRSWAMQRYFFDGASYIFTVRSSSGRVIELRPLDFNSITPVWVNGKKYFDFRPSQSMSGKPARYGPRDIIELPYRHARDRITPVSFLKDAARAIKLYYAIESYAGNFFNAGGVPPLVVQAPLSSEKAIERTKDDMQKHIMKTNSRGELIMVLPFGYEVKDLGVNPKDAQMVDAKLFQLTEIARHIGLPPMFLQDLSKGTYTNSEQQAIHVVKNRMRPLTRRLEGRFSLGLFGPGSPYSIRFDLNELLRGDTATRFNAWARGVQGGFLTPNEARYREDLPLLDQAGADELHMQTGTQLLGGENNDPAGAAPAAEPAAAGAQEQ